jgi:adenosylmethionine-8-amino-7-oxononanoate aminotransferase
MIHHPATDVDPLPSDPVPLAALAPAGTPPGGPSEEQLAALRAAGEAHLWPGPYKPGDLSSEHALKLAVGGAGPWVVDAEGRTWFDSLSGMWLTNVGHGRREIADAVYAQMCRLSYAPDGTVSPATIRLADRIAGLAPDPGSRVFFVSGGSEAVETAIKMARKFHRNQGEPGRFKLISRRGSYHGCTLACLSLGGGGSNTGVEYGPLLPGAVRVQGPDEFRPAFAAAGAESDLECAREIERAILNEGPETVAAVIGEPISAASGVHVPHPEYWPAVRAICDRYGVLLIFDEVITGFGRTGTMFASEHWGVEPDITTVAKGLTSGYAPMGAAIASKRVADAFTGDHPAFNHRFTFGGNPAACAAGLATLDIIERERLVDNSRRMGEYLFDRAQELYRYPIVGQVRGGLGLMCAVELVRDRATRERFPAEAGLKRAAQALMDKHGLLGRGGDIFFLAPSLCVTPTEIDDLIGRVDAVLGDLDRQLGSIR